MIETPYSFETKLSDDEFKKIGQFACRWALIEHTIANCLRVILKMEPEQATIMVFPLGLEARMQKISDLSELHLLSEAQLALLAQLKPLIKGMQFIRNTTLHGIATSNGPDGDVTHFNLRSKNRHLEKHHLFSCEGLINYTAHVTLAFRYSLGDKDGPWQPLQTLPDRPEIPEFLRSIVQWPKAQEKA